MSGDEIARVALAHAPAPDHHDAILAFTEHLAAALARRHDIAPSVLLRGRTRAWTTGDAHVPAPLHEALRRTGADELALQYNPFSYGRWGFAPGLLAELLSARRRGVLRRLVLVVHEPFVRTAGLRNSVMGTLQRHQLAALMHLAHGVLATTEAWLPLLGRVRPSVHVDLVPVGSNMPDQRADRASTRAALGASADTLVVSAFGLAHPHQLVGHVAAAIEVVLRDGHEIVFVSLGEAPDELALRHPRLRIVRPGAQDATSLAQLLAAADLFLAPYRDGVTARRTTLMAALQHGLCVVTTEGTGPHDRALGEPALAVVPLSERSAFAAASRALAGDVEARRRVGAAARELYEERYAWEVIATRFAQALGHSRAAPAQVP